MTAASTGSQQQWCVLQHFQFGGVEGEFFDHENHALARYDSLGMRHACMVIGPDGQELKYYGFRGGRDREMRSWWEAKIVEKAEEAEKAAEERWKPCPECKGSGKTSVFGWTCTFCSGTGRVKEKRKPEEIALAKDEEITTLDKMYCVAHHVDWGHVEGEFFTTADFALSCFKSLKFLEAAMVISPGGIEYEYWGARGGRDVEMKKWWQEQTERGDEAQSEVLQRSHEAPVMLHIYDVLENNKLVMVNSVLRVFGAGAYHAGVEVRGKEWFFGGFPEGSDVPADQPGISWYQPRECGFGKFRESVLMGRTALSEEEIEKMIDEMGRDWCGWSYSLLNKNCCHFAESFCYKLTGESVPRRLFRLGDGVDGVLHMVEEGKEARGDFSGQYKFGDITRGLVHKVFGAKKSDESF